MRRLIPLPMGRLAYHEAAHGTTHGTAHWTRGMTWTAHVQARGMCHRRYTAHGTANDTANDTSDMPWDRQNSNLD